MTEPQKTEPQKTTGEIRDKWDYFQAMAKTSPSTALMYWAKIRAYECPDRPGPEGFAGLWKEIRRTATDELSTKDWACQCWIFADGSSLAHHDCKFFGTDSRGDPISMLIATPVKQHCCAQHPWQGPLQ